MSKLIELMRKIGPSLERGDLDRCEQTVSDALKLLNASPFHIALDLQITNPAEAVAAFIDEFADKASQEIDLKAILAEMNGFDPNPDRWAFSVLGCEWFGGRESLDWVGDFVEESFEDMTIDGMKPLQQVYMNFGNSEDESIASARDAATLLVIVKFQKLIFEASKLVRKVDCPIAATAHGFDFLWISGKHETESMEDEPG